MSKKQSKIKNYWGNRYNRHGWHYNMVIPDIEYILIYKNEDIYSCRFNSHLVNIEAIIAPGLCL